MFRDLSKMSDAQLEDRLRELTTQRMAVVEQAREVHAELDGRLALERLAQQLAEAPEAERATAAMAALDPATRQQVYERMEKWASFRTEPDPLPEPRERRRRWLRP